MIKIGTLNFEKPPLLLAPMEDVSDPPFRRLCKKHGADIMYTEFISTEGLIRDAHKSVQKLDIYEEERPIGIQIFGGNIDSMLASVDIVEKAQPDIIDINYGCPVKNVVRRNAGAGILRDIPKMISMTEAIVKRTSLPVTVKTRLGWDHDSIFIEEVAERLQDVGIKGISIHGRTRKQMYKGQADWSWIRKVKENSRMHIPVFGNGDIDSPEKAQQYLEQYHVDGLMIGRATIGNPWIFNQIKEYMATGKKPSMPTVKERVEAAKQHLLHSIEWKGEKLGILEMRRHYAPYFKGIFNIKPYRMKLVTSESLEVLLKTLEEIEEKLGTTQFHSS